MDEESESKDKYGKYIASAHLGFLALSLATFFCQYSCHSSYKNKSTQFFLDSIESGYSIVDREYYDNGAVKLIIGSRSYHDTTYSVAVELYKDKVPNKVVHFRNGKRDGLAKSYYPTGEIESISRYVNDYKVGNSYFYYSNGKLRAYNCFDLAGSDFYVVLFDSTGEIIRDTGEIISRNIAVRLDTTVNQNRVFKFQLFVACHPTYKVVVQVGQFSEKDGIYKLKSYNISKSNSIFVNLTVHRSNKSKLVAIGRFLNPKTMKMIKADTMVYDVLD